MTHIDAFSQVAKSHSGEIMKACEINEEATKIIGHKPTMCASDFAKPETDHKRSKNNPVLFERIKKGVYKVL